MLGISEARRRCEDSPENSFAFLFNRLVLVLVLVLEMAQLGQMRSHSPGIVRIEALDQFARHCHSPDQYFFAGLNSFQRNVSVERKKLCNWGIFRRYAEGVRDLSPGWSEAEDRSGTLATDMNRRPALKERQTFVYRRARVQTI